MNLTAKHAKKKPQSSQSFAFIALALRTLRLKYYANLMLALSQIEQLLPDNNST